MKSLSAAVIVLLSFCNTVFGVSVVVKNNKVFVNDEQVDLSKLEVMKETDLCKTYVLHSGDSTITITKSKVGNAISVQSIGPMTPEEKEKMKKMQEKIGEDVEKNIQQVQEDINKFNQQLNQNINEMNQKIQKMFSSFPAFF